MLWAWRISQGTQPTFQRVFIAILVYFPFIAAHARGPSLSPKEAVTAEGRGYSVLSGMGVTELD